MDVSVILNTAGWYFQRGTQVAYVPIHADGDILHKDVEFGFIATSIDDKQAFVRYWVRGKEGVELRTKSCAELTNVDDSVRVIHHSVTPEAIEEQLRALGYYDEDEDAR